MLPSAAPRTVARPGRDAAASAPVWPWRLHAGPLLRRVSGSRRRQLALACLLFTATAVTVLLVPDFPGFSWRYQLPALVILPPASVLGITAILSSLRASREARRERLITTSDVVWLPGPPPGAQLARS